MDSNRGGSLIPWAVRSHRAGILSLGLGFGVLIAIMAPAYVAAANAIAGGLKAMGAEAQTIAASFQFLTGPAERLDTVGGYLSYKIYPDVALLLAIYAAIQGTQLIRGSETRGLLELWFSTGRPRAAIMRDRLCAFLIAISVSLVLIFVGTVLGGALAGVQLVMAALGQSVAVGFVALFALSLGLLLAQFFPTARTAAGLTCGFLVASFFVANMADQLGAATFIRYASPFYYYLHSRTLVAGNGFDLTSMAVLLAAAVMATAAAWFLFLGRDVGGVSLARLHHTGVVDYTFRPSVLWRRSLWLNWIAEQPVGIISWVLGIVALTTTEAAVVPSAMRIVNTGSGQFQRFLQQHGGLPTADQYLSSFIAVTALIVAGFTVSQVARWANDASQHRNDVVLSQAVSMWRLLVERTATVILLATIVGLAIVGGIFAGTVIGGYSGNVGGLVRTFFDIVLLSFAMGGVGMVATTVLRSAAATGVISALLFVCFFLTTVAGLLSWPQWTSRPSVFDAFGTPYLSIPHTGSLIYLAALGCGGVLVSYLAMRRGMRIAA